MLNRTSLLLAILAPAAFAQPASERTFTLRYADSPQVLQEVFNATRSIADIREGDHDRAAHTITFRGPAERLDAAAWVIQELDRPAQPSIPNSEMHESRLPGVEDGVLCVSYLSHVRDPRGIQELINAIRSITDVQRLFPMNAVSAMVMRGTAAQVKEVRWLAGELDRPSPATGGLPVIR
jgi:hypothetical protein